MVDKSSLRITDFFLRRFRLIKMLKNLEKIREKENRKKIERKKKDKRKKVNMKFFCTNFFNRFLTIKSQSPHCFVSQ